MSLSANIRSLALGVAAALLLAGSAQRRRGPGDDLGRLDGGL